MAEQDDRGAQPPPGPPAEPRGFGERTRGLAGEYAHEQGWGLNEEERSKEDSGPQDIDGGTDYEYGAQDFGDTPANTALPPDTREPIQNKRTNAGKES